MDSLTAIVNSTVHDTVKTSTQNEIANFHYNKGEYNQALSVWIQKLMLEEETGNKAGIAASLNNIGIVYKNQGEISKCLDYYHRSLKIREELGNKAGIAACLINIGNVYADQGETEKCLEHYHSFTNITFTLTTQGSGN